MAVRIYALAKELDLDSKVLVDLCPKAGVVGKGSALASLTDEEVDALRSYLRNGIPKAAPAPPPAPVVAPAPAPPPVVATVTIAPPIQAPEPAMPVVSAEGSSGMRRSDYISPGGVAGRPPLLVTRPDRGMGEARKRPGGDSGRPPSRSGPAIKLAPMPDAQQPTAPPQSNEPAPQKPDIKLPADVLRGARAGGGKPLADHIKKHTDKIKAEGDKSAKPGGAARQPAPPLAGGPGRDRPTRGKAPGKPGGTEEGDAAGPVSRGVRQLNRRKGSGARRRSGDDEDSGGGRRTIRRGSSRNSTIALPRKGNVSVQLPCTVRSFSEAIGIPAAKVMGKLLSMGKMLRISDSLEAELAETLAVEMGLELDFKHPVDPGEENIKKLEEPDADELKTPRPPVVTFLGHVDHGKTSLLDSIIGIDVASGESGGITQHIRAYRIERDGKIIAFVDTPGHEAFTQMRARGAQVTDIAVLVVAADDGIMPQTEEAISHAKAAGVPIVVALNKIDLPGINVQRIYEQLAANELLPVEWGGETEVVKCSALTGEGMDKLVETLLLTAELHDYRVRADRPAVGACLEAELHEGRGVVAKFLVQRGTLKVGDIVLCGAAYGRVKAMYDTLQRRTTHDEAGPSTPVNITGLDEAPAAGERFYVFDDIAVARDIAAKRARVTRAEALGGQSAHVTLENLFNELGKDEVRMLNLILRADVRGSIEAIRKELSKLDHPEVQIKILQATVGGVTEADVHLADASDAIILGFNVVPDEGARALSERLGVQIRRYEIIYQVTGDLKAALEGMLKPERRDVDLGRALVQRLYVISRVGTIAGCRVLSGTIERNSRIRVIRDSRIIGDYGLDSLKREKDDAREVREGLECGIKLVGFNDLKEGDILEAYKVEEFARSI